MSDPFIVGNMEVTFYSPDPKISPVQILVQDVHSWCILVRFYFSLQKTYSKIDFEWYGDTKDIFPSEEISPFAFIPINHRYLSLLLKEYFGYCDLFQELRDAIPQSIYCKLKRINSK